MRDISDSNESVAEKSSLGRRLSLVLSSADQNTAGRLLPPAAVFLFFFPSVFLFIASCLAQNKEARAFSIQPGTFYSKCAEAALNELLE